MHRKQQSPSTETMDTSDPSTSTTVVNTTTVKNFVHAKTQTDPVLVLPCLPDPTAAVIKEDEQLSKLAYLNRKRDEMNKKLQILISNEMNENTCFTDKNTSDSVTEQQQSENHSSSYGAVDTAAYGSLLTSDTFNKLQQLVITPNMIGNMNCNNDCEDHLLKSDNEGEN